MKIGAGIVYPFYWIGNAIMTAARLFDDIPIIPWIIGTFGMIFMLPYIAIDSKIPEGEDGS